MAHALTLVDGLAVIGGGVSGAWPLFLPALVDELNSTYTGPKGVDSPPGAGPSIWKTRRSGTSSSRARRAR